ncbi:nitrate reductase [Oricola sp.]|uniref:nitrate reductase n=1 Tax=Oricola sp. TaxID=1979950 RepID=UPI0025D21343|nr:nitrate reductase [Oricola sp.]MCI5078671.1 molybdopterin-dependent oxidoreductase [Oricola sp.]
MSEGVRTTCPYCGVGCGVVVARKDDGAVTVKGDKAHPANFGRLCSKGSALGETVDLDGRLLHPEIGGRQAGWDEALDLVASRFSDAIAEYGPDSVAFYVSGQILTEDYYAANKLMKGFIGSANIDTNSRLCMASSVAGHRRAFGTDTVPGTYEDLELADLIVLTGTNLAWCHPVLYQRIAAAKAKRPEMKVVLIDPRRTMTADIADMHLAIAPDGDIALFAGLLAYLAEVGAVDMDYMVKHTTGFVDAVERTLDLHVPEVAALTGLTANELYQFYALFAKTEKTVTVYSQGVNQSSIGTDKVNAIINCHLATGRIGRPGMGPFSVTGQPNAMGGREVGGLANMLAAHLDIENPEHRAIAQRFWHAPAIPEKPGLKAVDLFKAVGEGRIKALWIMATNPVDSMPDADAVRAALEICPFVVVSDVNAETDTTCYADVLLPSAAWGEKDGTVTNSERCVSRQRAFLPLPGDARPDWWQMAQIGRRMGFEEAFDWESPEQLFAEYAAMTGFENAGSRDLDISAHEGIGAEDYGKLAPFRWPQPAGVTPISDRFFANGGFFTPDRRGRFVATDIAIPSRVTNAYPLVLNTGRVRDHWHTMTRTGKSQRLSAHIGEPYAELHPADAGALGIADADIVEIESPHGRVLVRALVSPRQQAGSVFVPMHWNGQFAANARIDVVVAPVTDPHSGQPASKHVAVSARRFPARVFGFAVSAEKPVPPQWDYWALAKLSAGWKIELASGTAVEDIEDFACQLFGVAPSSAVEIVSFGDTASGAHRVATFDGGRLVGALFLAPQPVEVSRSWAAGQLAADHSDPATRWRLVAGRPGADMPDKGAIVCSCFGVGSREIAAAVRDGCTSVEAVGKQTCAGTNCGSCKSEIREIVDEHRIVAAE